jgi:kynurenine formamidase
MRLIDLSATIATSPPGTPPPLRTELAYNQHAAGAAQIAQLFQVPARLLRDSEGWATEEFTRFGTHDSTHVDAPWHYNSHIQGRRAQTIDELPLDWFFAPGVVLEMRHKADGDPVGAAEVRAELERIGHTLRPRDIVLVRTGRDAFYGQPDYMFRGCGVTAEATRWLYEQGVRVMGIDAWGWDAPLDRQAREALAGDRQGVFWAAHQVDLPYSQIERLVNLDALPPSGFTVACFPLKIAGGSAGPARVVAILPDGEA